MNDLFNNREIAVGIWLFAIAVFTACSKAIRASATDVLKAFFNPRLIIPLLASFLPTVALLGILAHFNLWELSVLKETIYWFIGTGLVMFGASTKVVNAKALFKQTAKDTLKLVIFLEFFIGFYVFPIWVELLMVPFITFIIMLATVAGYQKGAEYDLTKKFLSQVTAAIGLAIMFFGAMAFIHNPKPLFSYQNLELFLLPIILSCAYAPFVYLLALYSKYELVFLRVDMFLEHIDDRRALKLACIKRCGLSVQLAGGMIRHLAINLTNDTTKKQALKLIEDFDPKRPSKLA
jgi:hypothetical protein